MAQLPDQERWKHINEKSSCEAEFFTENAQTWTLASNVEHQLVPGIQTLGYFLL